jgi:hypothetical protein
MSTAALNVVNVVNISAVAEATRRAMAMADVHWGSSELNSCSRD